MRHLFKFSTLLAGLALALVIAVSALSSGAQAQEEPGLTLDKQASASVIECGGNVTVTLTIEGVQPPPGEGLSAVDAMLVIDRSGSMGGQPIIDARTAASSFVDILDDPPDGDNPDGTLAGTNQAGLVTYASSATLDQELTQDATALQTAIAAISAGGGTAIHAGIDTAQTELESVRHNPDATPIMLVMTDGRSNFDLAKAAADAAKAAGTVIFSIGLGNNLDEALLEEIASDPVEDHLFIAPTGEELIEIFKSIAQTVTAPDPAATDATVTDTVNSEFAIVDGSVSASKGSANVADDTITWSIDQIDTETLTLQYQVTHVGDEGEHELNTPAAVIEYIDHEGAEASATFPTPSVSCAEEPVVLEVVEEPEALPETGGAPAGGSGSEAWLAVVVAFGALLTAGGAALAYARRRVR